MSPLHFNFCSRFATILRLASFVFVVTAGSLALGKTAVAWVFATPELCKTKICLHGNHPKGAEIILLSKKTAKTCNGTVGDGFKAHYEPGAFEASEVKLAKSCKLDAKDLFLAVFEKSHAKYKIISSSDLDDDDLKKMDKKLKKDLVFTRTWKKEVFRPGGNRDRVPYTIADYRRLSTEGFEFKLKKQEPLQVFRQKFADNSNPGYLFAFYKNNWSVVSSTFSQGDPFVFMLGSRMYIVSKVTCQLACGYIDNEVYEFNGRVFRLIYNNADLST